MRYGSVCSGIEAATVAWKPLGFEAAWFSEIEPFPCELLEQKYPGVPNYGDMTSLKDRILSGEIEATDIVCGGTPCQAFSLAGKRESLDDDRGNLSLEFCNIVDAIDEVRIKHGKPQTIVFWENVPGVLSTKDNAFGCFLGQLVGASTPLTSGANRWPNVGYVAGPKRKAAWRVLDAQHFGVPQRRRRVFVIASAREDFDPSKVLFEQTSLRGDSASGGSQGQDITSSTKGRTGENSERVGFREGSFGQFCESDKAGTTKATGGCLGGGSETLVVDDTSACLESCYDMSHSCDVIRDEKVFPTLTARMGTGGNQVPIVLMDQGGDGMTIEKDKVGTLRAQTHEHEPVACVNEAPVAFRISSYASNVMKSSNPNSGIKEAEISPTIDTTQPSPAKAQGGLAIVSKTVVRKLTPVECERLQGFPDDYTRIPYRGKTKEQCPDSPRYKAIGNSWAVPVVRWLGKRIKNIVNHEVNNGKARQMNLMPQSLAMCV